MKWIVLIWIIMLALFQAFQFGRRLGQTETVSAVQEKINRAMEERLSNCINKDTFEYNSSDWCLYGQGGYQLN